MELTREGATSFSVMSLPQRRRKRLEQEGEESGVVASTVPCRDPRGRPVLLSHQNLIGLHFGGTHGATPAAGREGLERLA